MTHDFAKQRAARTGRGSKPPSPPSLWFVSGLVMGVLLSFLVYLASLAPGPGRPLVATIAEQPENAPAKNPKSREATEKPKFIFYTELPAITTEAPAEPGSEPANATEPPAATPAQPAAPAKPVSKATIETPEPAPAPAIKPPVKAPPPVDVPEPVLLTLQAGAFRDPADANRRRADITLLGYPARVEAAGGPEARYRVHVGPFPSASARAEARGALKDQGIDVL
jgi:cell division protein FtsN